jgi:molecular chaperone DnaK
MSEDKVKYGIDLGTTNSAICRVENGDPRIIKSDQFQKDTTPSCVSINKKQVINVGDLAFNARGMSFAKKQNNPDAIVDDSYIEFKRTMGSDKEFESVHLGKKLTSEWLSAEVLKKLKSYVSDDEVRGAVVTVPAKFTSSQINATQKAAEMAGFEYVELLQEPIAASIAYGVKSESADGKWVVFDFGGGTFDAALMYAEDGIMQVIDTEGDNFLGGKNLDVAIIDELLVPYLKENYSVDSYFETDEKTNIIKGALKKAAEQAKIALSTSETHTIYQEDFIEKDDAGDEVELDLTISIGQYAEVVSPIFQKAIDVTLELLKRNNLSSKDITKVVLAGGPTLQQTCRKMLKEQMDCEIDVSIDPMTAVADGAAISALTKNLPDDLKVRDNTKVQLELQYEATSVEAEEYVTVMVDKENTEGDVSDKLFLEIVNKDGSWASGRSELVGGSEVVFVTLSEGKSNSFEIKIFDEQGTKIPSQPDSFSILQGVKVANPTLPYHAGLGTIDASTGRDYLDLIEGLEKNQNLPAKGKGIYKTTQDLRPGRSDDVMRLPIYEAEYNDEGTNPNLCEVMCIGKITGEELSGLVPENSQLELTIKIDTSRRVSGSVFFKHTDDDIDIEFEHSTNKLLSQHYLGELINKGRATLTIDEDELFASNEEKRDNLISQIDELQNQLGEGGADDDTRIQINTNLRKILKEIYLLEQIGEWPKVVDEIEEQLKALKDIQAQYGNEETKKLISDLKSRAEAIIAENETKLGKKLIKDIRSLKFTLLRRDPNFYISILSQLDRDFEMHEWKNPSQAKQLLESAKRSIVARDFTLESLDEQTRGIYGCMKNPRRASQELTDKTKVTRID